VPVPVPATVHGCVGAHLGENGDCAKGTFVEQVDGPTERYQRRTPALRRVVEAVAVELVGSAGARLLAVVHCLMSGAAVLDSLKRIRPQILSSRRKRRR
jgi:hypothetical protein